MATEDTPYIAPPDKMDNDARNGLVCFLNPGRVCGADCMSYLTFALPSKTSELGPQQEHCLLLSCAYRTSKHAIIHAKTASQILDELKRNNAAMAAERLKCK